MRPGEGGKGKRWSVSREKDASSRESEEEAEGWERCAERLPDQASVSASPVPLSS